MIELNASEIDQVSGALGLLEWLEIGNALLEFGKGFIDGVNAAQG